MSRVQGMEIACPEGWADRSMLVLTAPPGASGIAANLMVSLFGDAGRHARSAVGVYRIPLGYAVEVDAVIEVASGA